MSHSIAYQRGYRAALRDLTIASCPYEGHCDASLHLQGEWLDGHFDALTMPRIVHKRRYLTRRRNIRKPLRSVYARHRLEQIIAERSSLC